MSRSADYFQPLATVFSQLCSRGWITLLVLAIVSCPTYIHAGLPIGPTFNVSECVTSSNTVFITVTCSSIPHTQVWIQSGLFGKTSTTTTSQFCYGSISPAYSSDCIPNPGADGWAMATECDTFSSCRISLAANSLATCSPSYSGIGYAVAIYECIPRLKADGSTDADVFALSSTVSQSTVFDLFYLQTDSSVANVYSPASCQITFPPGVQVLFRLLDVRAATSNSTGPCPFLLYINAGGEVSSYQQWCVQTNWNYDEMTILPSSTVETVDIVFMNTVGQNVVNYAWIMIQPSLSNGSMARNINVQCGSNVQLQAVPTSIPTSTTIATTTTTTTLTTTTTSASSTTTTTTSTTTTPTITTTTTTSTTTTTTSATTTQTTTTITLTTTTTTTPTRTTTTTTAITPTTTTTTKSTSAMPTTTTITTTTASTATTTTTISSTTPSITTSISTTTSSIVLTTVTATTASPSTPSTTTTTTTSTTTLSTISTSSLTTTTITPIPVYSKTASFFTNTQNISDMTTSYVIPFIVTTLPYLNATAVPASNGEPSTTFNIIDAIIGGCVGGFILLILLAILIIVIINRKRKRQRDDKEPLARNSWSFRNNDNDAFVQRQPQLQQPTSHTVTSSSRSSQKSATVRSYDKENIYEEIQDSALSPSLPPPPRQIIPITTSIGVTHVEPSQVTHPWVSGIARATTDGGGGIIVESNGWDMNGGRGLGVNREGGGSKVRFVQPEEVSIFYPGNLSNASDDEKVATLRSATSPIANERHRPRSSLKHPSSVATGGGGGAEMIPDSTVIILPRQLAEREAAAAAAVNFEGGNIQLNPLYGVKSDIYMY